MLYPTELQAHTLILPAYKQIHVAMFLCCTGWDVFTMKATPATRKHQKPIHVGNCLYRSSRTDVYYAIFQRDGKQVKRSLKTTNPELAKRRREVHRQKFERLNSDGAQNLPFAEYDVKTKELIGGFPNHTEPIARFVDKPSVWYAARSVY